MLKINMTAIRTAVTIGAAALIAGCAVPQQTGTQLQERTANAEKITDTGVHDHQLMVIAGDAANAHNSEACLKAVSDISDSAGRDNSAHACAETFYNVGDSQTANKLVDMISDQSLRDSLRTKYSNAH